MVTFAAGYIAGVFCAIVSHPADTVVSKLNQEKGSTALEAAKKLGFAGKITVYVWKVTCHSIFSFHCFSNVNLSSVSFDHPCSIITKSLESVFYLIII